MLAALAFVVGLFCHVSPAFAGSITWSGKVDDNVDIVIRGNSVSYQNITDAGLQNTAFRFNGGIFPEFSNLRLENVSGRGTVTIFRRSRPNGEAIVRIQDPQLGAGFYRFTLAWDDNGTMATSGGPFQGNANGTYEGNTNGVNGNGNGPGKNSLHWHGTVAGAEAVHVQGSTVTWNRVNGTGAWAMSFDLNGRMPPRAVTISVIKNRGRGNVYVLRQPTPENGYKFTIRIEDDMPGSDTYDFTATW
jgi:hypothetical protein